MVETHAVLGSSSSVHVPVVAAHAGKAFDLQGVQLISFCPHFVA